MRTTSIAFGCALALAAGCAENKPAETAYGEPTAAEARAAGTTSREADPAYRANTDGTTAPDANTVPANSSATRDEPATTGVQTRDPAPPPNPDTGFIAQPSNVAPDNTGVNKRDRDGTSATPMDQGNSKQDIQITADIRKAVVKDGSLSTTAKNVKIITKDGNVLLRGPVHSDAERSTIEAKAIQVAGAGHVSNQLEISK
jgi:hypothetical protein